MTTPNAAPPEMPSTEGSASGLRVSAWNPTPATASAPPASAATAIRGSRMASVTTRSTDSGAARPVTAAKTALGEIDALPTKSAPAAATSSAADRTTSTRSKRWPVAVEQIAVHRAEAPGLDRGELAEAPPLLHRDRPAVVPVIRQQNHLGAARHRGLEAVARIGVVVVGGQRSAAGELDELGDDRAAPGHDERPGPQPVEDARAAGWGPGL